MLISRQTTLENKFFKLTQDKAHPNTVFSCSQASRKFLFQELPLQTRMQSELCAKKSNSLQVQKESWKTSDNQVRKKKSPFLSIYSSFITAKDETTPTAR